MKATLGTVVLLAMALSCAPKLETAFALPFMENDAAAALARARGANRPLFVEVWAPW